MSLSDDAFSLQKAAILSAGGFVHPSAQFVSSEHGGVRLDIQCDKDTISILAPKSCAVEILSVDFERPRSAFIASIIEFWRHSYPVIDNPREFVGNRFFDGLVVPLMSWADHSEGSHRPIYGSGAFAMAGSFVCYSRYFRRRNGHANF